MILKTKTNLMEKPIANPYKAINMKIIKVRPNPNKKAQALHGAYTKTPVLSFIIETETIFFSQLQKNPSPLL